MFKLIPKGVRFFDSFEQQSQFNYLVGNERTDDDHQFKHLRHLLDAQVNAEPIARLNMSLNADYTTEADAIRGTKDAQWYGLTGWIRYRLTDALEPAFRAEWYRDENGFTTGVKQTLIGLTATLNWKIGLWKLANKPAAAIATSPASSLRSRRDGAD